MKTRKYVSLDSNSTLKVRKLKQLRVNLLNCIPKHKTAILNSP